MMERCRALLIDTGIRVTSRGLRSALLSSGFRDLGQHRLGVPQSAVDAVLDAVPGAPEDVQVVPGSPSACVQYSELRMDCTARMFLELVPLMKMGFSAPGNLFTVTDVPERAVDVALAYLLSTYSSSRGYYCVRAEPDGVMELAGGGTLCAAVHQPLELQEAQVRACTVGCVLFCLSEIGTTAPPWPEAAVDYSLATYLGASAVSLALGGEVPVFGFSASQHNPWGGSIYLSRSIMKAQYLASEVCARYRIPLALSTGTNSTSVDMYSGMETALSLAHCMHLNPGYVFTGGWLNPESGWCWEKMCTDIRAMRLLSYPRGAEEYPAEHTENWIFHEEYAEQYRRLAPEEAPVREIPEAGDSSWREVFIRISEGLGWNPRDWLKQLESCQKPSTHGR